MGREKIPSTPAVKFLRKCGVNTIFHLYRYEDRGGTGDAARKLGLDEHAVIKTLVMETESKDPLIVLMHGDMHVSTKKLARLIGVKTVEPCEPATAHKHTGYFVGGTSPFGTLKKLPVYMESTVMDLPRVYINAGRRGLLVDISSADLQGILSPIPVDIAI
ncbi:MAG: aminoacyl-tRNA deacylase [Desulfatiglandaceae bacterium]